MTPGDAWKGALRGRRGARALAPLRARSATSSSARRTSGATTTSPRFQRSRLDQLEGAGARLARSGQSISPLKKLLMTFMILGAMGTTVGAGTFASFNANTTNAGSTFQSGTIVLSNSEQKAFDPVATTCISTGGGTTDVNSESASCGTTFDANNASIMRPGEIATVDLTLQNLGSLTGTLAAYMPSACQDGSVSGAAYNGTGLPCQSLQFSIQEYSDAARTTPSACRYGAGATGVLTGSALTFNKTIGASTSNFKILVNGVTATTDSSIAQATYTSIDTLAAAVQTAARANPVSGASGVIVTGTTDNKLQFSNPLKTGTNNIGIVAAAANSALATIGLTAGTTATGGATTCTLSDTVPDSTHTLGNYFAAYPTAATGLTLSTLSPNQSRYYRISMLLPTGISNLFQGRKATFAMNWTLLQS